MAFEWAGSGEEHKLLRVVPCSIAKGLFWIRILGAEAVQRNFEWRTSLYLVTGY